MSWVHVYRLQLVMQATSRQCSWSTMKSEVRSWTTQPNYDVEYTTQVIQEISLCDAELQRIMSWMHACRQQVIQVTFRQRSMMEFDRTPHNLWRGMLHSCRSRDITVQPRTVENNQLDAFTHGTGHTGNVSLVFQVTCHQCFRQPFTNVSGNLSPVFQATFHSVSWWSLIVHHTNYHVEYATQVIQETIIMQRRTAENNELGACLHWGDRLYRQFLISVSWWTVRVKPDHALTTQSSCGVECAIMSFKRCHYAT